MNADSQSVLTRSDDFPVRVARPVHSGKVRSVYFLTREDSKRLIDERGYAVSQDSDLAIMVISDRLSAFDCLWRSETFDGVRGKGAALNAIAAHWFASFTAAGLPPNHLLESPHPMLWVVRQAKPVLIEAIARRYLTGSLWRAYEKGERQAGGVKLADMMSRYGRLPELLFTPSTKGLIAGLDGVPETDDAPIDPQVIRRHAHRFGLRDSSDLDAIADALRRGFEVIEQALEINGELLVDTKFEFGFAPSLHGGNELLYMDEVGTPDSSRIWRFDEWSSGSPREHSKEQFREGLLAWVDDPDLLLNAARMPERSAFAQQSRLPDQLFTSLAATYQEKARAILGVTPRLSQYPRQEMLEILSSELRLLN